MKISKLEALVLEEILKNDVIKINVFLKEEYGFIEPQLNQVIQKLLIKEYIFMNNNFLTINKELINKVSNIKLKSKNIKLLFDDFWKVYPLKKGKQQALKAFIKLNPNEEMFNDMIKGLNKQIKIRKEKEKKREWVEAWKFPQGWINGRRWEDEDEDVIDNNIYQQPKYYKSDR
jgi:hypothetical protein